MHGCNVVGIDMLVGGRGYVSVYICMCIYIHIYSNIIINSCHGNNKYCGSLSLCRREKSSPSQNKMTTAYGRVKCTMVAKDISPLHKSSPLTGTSSSPAILHIIIIINITNYYYYNTTAKLLHGGFFHTTFCHIFSFLFVTANVLLFSVLCLYLSVL